MSPISWHIIKGLTLDLDPLTWISIEIILPIKDYSPTKFEASEAKRSQLSVKQDVNTDIPTDICAKQYVPSSSKGVGTYISNKRPKCVSKRPLEYNSPRFVKFHLKDTRHELQWCLKLLSCFPLIWSVKMPLRLNSFWQISQMCGPSPLALDFSLPRASARCWVVTWRNKAERYA